MFVKMDLLLGYICSLFIIRYIYKFSTRWNMLRKIILLMFCPTFQSSILLPWMVCPTFEYTIIITSLDLFRNFLKCTAEIWNTAGLYQIYSKVCHYLHVTCNMSLACTSLKWVFIESIC